MISNKRTSVKYILSMSGAVLLVTLAGCGGGGGSAGTPSGSSGATKTTTVVVSSDPVLRGVLQDATGAPTSSISASGFTVLNVTLTDPSGKGLANQVVNATGDATKVIFPEGSGGLTNAAGVATIKLARASLFATGADVLTLTYSYKAGSFTTFPDGSAPLLADKTIARYVGFQLAAANVSLGNLNIGAGQLAAYGTRQVAVQVNINGTAASSAPVQVSFSANCGTVTPATVSTNSQGVAQVSYSAINPSVTNDQGCSGSVVSIVASTLGASPVSGNLSIDLAPATNLLFIDAKPSTIFLVGSGGTTQSVVKFKLVNSSNIALQGQNVLFELRDLAGGIPKTSFGTIGNVAPITLPTNSSGEVSVPVFSGTVPTNVSIKATLLSNVSVTTSSAVLAIASGRAVQSRVSLAIEKFAIEGANVDGVTTGVTMSLADRQGNPVPDGTAINFVTEGGVMIPPVCTTVNSSCSVLVRSQNPRPADGRVSILAYALGEEDFVDLNFDNVYTPGEPFVDLGNAFRDDAARVTSISGTYVPGYFSVPRAGSAVCVNVIPGQTNFLGRPDSCDGVWGAADVRQQGIIIFATGAAVISAVAQTGNNLVYSVADGNGNSVPTGSAIEVSPPVACPITNGSSVVVANSLSPATFSAGYRTFSGGPCPGGTVITVKVTSPLGLVSTRSFGVPATPPVALTVLSGATASVLRGSARLTTVSGGTGPYSVGSSDVAVATVALSGSALTITGVAAGTATVIVSDTTGAEVIITVTVN